MDLVNQKCVPCEGGTQSLTPDEIKPYIENIKDWDLDGNGKRIKKDFKFKDFKEALSFVNKVGEIAESESHHPDIELGYGKVKIELSTHAIGGLSVNDFISAAKIDQLG